MRKLWYMGLEPYKARYTLQLQEWNRAVFERRGINYEIVPGETLSNDQAIVTCLLYTSPSPRDRQKSRMPSSA